MTNKAKPDELSEEALKPITGGSNYDTTEMRCLTCGFTASWKGDYRGRVFDCQNCGFHTFTSVNLDDDDIRHDEPKHKL